MGKAVKLKDKFRKVTLRNYISVVSISLAFSIFFAFVVTSVVDVPQVRNLISKNVSYVYGILREKIISTQKLLLDNLKDILYKVERSIDATGITQETLDKIFPKYKKELESIDYISRVDYYIIDKEGKIILTSYATDLGLDLSQFRDFWKNLNRELSNEDFVYHPFTAEILTGKGRVYVYKKLKDSNILGIGVKFSSSFFKAPFEILDNLKDLNVIKDINVYSQNFKPFAAIFKPLKDSEIRLYEEKLSKSDYYLEGSFGLKKRLIIKFENNPFGDYIERNFIVVDLNFVNTYLWNLLNLVLVLIILLMLEMFGINKFSNEVSKEIEHLNDVISSYDPTNPDLEKIYNVETDIVEFQEILSTFQTMLEHISDNMQEMKAINEELENSYREIEDKSNELEAMFWEFAEKLALIAEGHDESMEKHLKRVRKLTGIILDNLDLPENLKREILNYSVLHDVGKLFVPPEILNKRGRLTDDEFEIVKKHTIYAERLLDNPHFKVALNIAMYHHENYDGTGYPKGLKGEEIPIEAQIIKIVDVYDALRSERPYKKAFTHEEAMEIMLKGDNRTSPSNFNPRLLKIFVSLSDKIKEVYDD